MVRALRDSQSSEKASKQTDLYRPRSSGTDRVQQDPRGSRFLLDRRGVDTCYLTLLSGDVASRSHHMCSSKGMLVFLDSDQC